MAIICTFRNYFCDFKFMNFWFSSALITFFIAVVVRALPFLVVIVFEIFIFRKSQIYGIKSNKFVKAYFSASKRLKFLSSLECF